MGKDGDLSQLPGRPSPATSPPIPPSSKNKFQEVFRLGRADPTPTSEPLFVPHNLQSINLVSQPERMGGLDIDQQDP